MLIQLELANFGVDPSRNVPVIVLKEVGGERSFVVPIGPFEASAIAVNTMDVTLDKPQLLDLTRMILETMGGTLQRLIIEKGEQEGELNARMQITRGRNTYVLTCAAAHAIVLALRCGSPIFIADTLFEEALDEDAATPERMLRRHISSLDTIDFGTYHLE